MIKKGVKAILGGVNKQGMWKMGLTCQAEPGRL
jgi:hypothetical protein